MNQEHLELRYIPLSQARLWDEAPRVGMPILIATIERCGFLAPPRFDAALGCLVDGEGRMEAVEQIRRKWWKAAPRGIRVSDQEEWLVPVFFEVDAEDPGAEFEEDREADRTQTAWAVSEPLEGHAASCEEVFAADPEHAETDLVDLGTARTSLDVPVASEVLDVARQWLTLRWGRVELCPFDAAAQHGRPAPDHPIGESVASCRAPPPLPAARSRKVHRGGLQPPRSEAWRYPTAAERIWCSTAVPPRPLRAWPQAPPFGCARADVVVARPPRLLRKDRPCLCWRRKLQAENDLNAANKELALFAMSLLTNRNFGVDFPLSHWGTMI